MVIIYDLNMKKVAFLENAFKVGYEQKHNEVWNAHFSLPANDSKNEYCQPFNYVEIYEGVERVELFRILPQYLGKEDTAIRTYHCEHVLATLMDDILFQYHEIGGIGTFTTQVFNYIISKQSVQRWVLGTIGFSRQFQYNWENENLLASIFSVPKPFIEEYKFTFDTTSYPWTLNLVGIEDEVKSYIRYKKNMRGIRKEEDPTDLCTRLYCLGYGEGVNQLNIKAVNNGLPYLEASTINKYGIISKVFVDRRFENEEVLKARGQALLNELQIPRLSYEVDAAELFQLTDDPVDKFETSTYTRVIDTELGENVKALIVSKRKPDITANPGECTIAIANKPKDIAGSISDLADRTRINEVYSQGATNLDSHDFADNCDQNNPAVVRFFIPEEMKKINKMILNYLTDAFRAYSKAIEGGGAVATSTESGGASSQTSSSGGGVATSTASGGGTSTASASGGGTTKSSGGNVWYSDYGYTSGFSVTDLVGDPPHRHAIADVNHLHSVTIPDHTHNVYIPSHVHAISIPNHTHDVNIPNHSHNINIPNHTHQIEYGIFRSNVMPTSVEIKVDGNIIPVTSLESSDIDIVPYLSKDSGGRIQRGAWHEITITPNNLARVTANLVQQMFIQSRGGGDF